MTISNDVCFGDLINNSNVVCVCYTCNNLVVMKVDPFNFEFGLPCTCLCDSCMQAEKNNKDTEKILHVLRMTVNAKKGVTV